MIIRKAKKDDSSILDGLFLALLKTERENYDENIKENLTINGFFEKIGIENQIVFVAEDNDKIMGYIYGYINKDNKIKVELEANIDSLFVIEKYRNNKIGTKLIDKFVEEVKNNNCKYIFIDNKYFNKGAAKLYNNLGFDIFIESRRKKI